MPGDGLEPQELARSITRLLDWAYANSPPQEEPPIRRRLLAHLGADLAELPVVSAPLPGYERVNFQVALDAFLAEEGRSAELIGLSAMHGYRFGLAELGQPASRHAPMPEPGPPEYETAVIGERRISCVAAGLWLLDDGGTRLALLLRREDHGPRHAELGLEVMAARREDAEALLAGLQELMHEHNVYRARVLELSRSEWGGIGVTVRRLPAIARERIVLRAGVLERIERHTEHFSAHAEELRRSGRHLRRGLLMHGPPGTGKTLTAMYLSTLMPDRTTILLTGGSLGGIEEACDIARRLAPAMVVLEDVDLVAMERGYDMSPGGVLFDLLNEMDGLNEDVDVLFVMTTNRADVLEPALAARPGRVDLAVELPLPDADARSRLIDLYGEGLELDLRNRARIVERTQGASPAFIRELLRRAALIAAERGAGTRLTDGDVSDALDELRQAGSELTQRLLGAGAETAGHGHPAGLPDAVASGEWED